MSLRVYCHGADLFKKGTRHLISTREFERMKDGVVVVNTARGAIIDEAALVSALEEPNIHPGLMINPNAMCLPHMGTWSLEVCEQGISAVPGP
jgi:glyoxylate reductase